jgi:hypothetical protein
MRLEYLLRQLFGTAQRTAFFLWLQLRHLTLACQRADTENDTQRQKKMQPLRGHFGETQNLEVRLAQAKRRSREQSQKGPLLPRRRFLQLRRLHDPH